MTTETDQWSGRSALRLADVAAGDRIRESEQLWLRLDELRHDRLQERTLAALYDAAIGLRVRNTTCSKG